jgi:hypothetical protein
MKYRFGFAVEPGEVINNPFATVYRPDTTRRNMNVEIALAMMLVETEAELFVKRYKRYVDRDDIDLPDCSDLERALEKVKEARRKADANNTKPQQQ